MNGDRWYPPPSMAASAETRRLPSGVHGLPRDVIERSQRERLLEAMVRAAADKGYEATTVADVIAVAGVSRTTFYEMFSDKEDCFLAAYDAVVDVLVHAVTTAYRQHDGDWPARIHAGIAALAGLLADEAAIARLAMVEVTAAGPAARQRYRDALDRFTPFLDEGRGHSKASRRVPATTSRLAIGGAAALIFDEVRAGRGPELRRLIPDLVFAVLMPFIGPVAAAREMRKPLAPDRS